MPNTCASVHTTVEFWVLALSIFFEIRILRTMESGVLVHDGQYMAFLIEISPEGPESGG